MASRRPASRALPPPSRPRSVIAKQPPARPPNDQHNDPLQKSTSEATETNIQVVIRCRRRSDREQQDGSPIIVSSNGAKSKEISITSSSPASSLGVVSLPPVKTYGYDLVFGPEADQAMVYHEVVSPMLEQVLLGYNCTLFAYGQTGSGKTYTMQGDLKPTPMGNPSTNAGMIPRVLFRLFHQLESSGTDYSVKISFIELYNEELRDLLATDFSAPSGSTQPMGMAAKDNTKNPDGGLKIFDDASKRGVFIQGLEEVTVQNSKDALALLTKGSDRRQTAYTQSNDHSSRSHSVFSITVHIKETSTMGDDLLKIGKLNLVDLAGSENIGRSGAENKRAREAGMINQSLLTLGRVINALVDPKAQHVPYRESKLTRLLQDSLGGRTKTCIIATVSPSRSNMEETLSTLDYALRAKSICNKPELNQRMTRNSLLKEYVAEIERLKTDLLAAREKNGIYFSSESWAQINAEQELQQTEMEEAKKQVEIVESQMRSVREEFEQSIALLMKRDEELRETRERLEATQEVLGHREGELRIVKGALQDETVVRQAHQDTEVALNEVAIGLKTIATQGVNDVRGLFDKLERKSNVLSSNSRIVLTNGTTISTSTNVLIQKLAELIELSTPSMSKIRDEAKQFGNKELEVLASHSERIDRQLHNIQETLSTIHAKDKAEVEALSVAQNILKETHETLRIGFGTWGENLKATCQSICKELELAGTAGFAAVENALKVMASLVDAIIAEAKEYVEAECESIHEAKTMSMVAANDEIERLEQQNEKLMQMLEDEKMKSNQAKDELVHRVSVLLAEFTEDRDRHLRDAVGIIRSQNSNAEEGMRAYLGRHEEVIKGMKLRGAEVDSSLQNRRVEGKRMRDGAFKILSNEKENLSNELSRMQATVSSTIESYSTQVQKQTKTMSSSCTDAFDRHSRAKRARVEATTTMGGDVQSEYRHMQRGIASTSRKIEEVAGRMISESTGLSNAMEAYSTTASSELTSIQQAAQTLTEKGARGDLPTGTTPRKRVWQYVDEWELTKNRDDVLRVWTEQRIAAATSETFVAEHLPLPDDEDLEDLTETGIMFKKSSSPKAVTPPIESPIAVSLASSLSTSTSTSSSIPPVPYKQVQVPVTRKRGLSTSKSVVPPIGTLTDARNVYTTRASRRAR